MTRRVHTSIDLLPENLRDELFSMIVDGDWPDDWPAEKLGETKGKPIYNDLVLYAGHKGHKISLSAVGRWAKPLHGYETLRIACESARVATKDMTAETASENQKAAAEMITAHMINLMTSEDSLTTKQAQEVSKAIKDCTAVALQSDQYIRQQLDAKAKTADATVTAIVKKKRIDPETLKLIREQIYGIVA